jgi:Subtilase family
MGFTMSRRLTVVIGIGALLGAGGAVDASPAQGSSRGSSASEATIEVKFAESLKVRGAGAGLHSEQGRSLSRVADLLTGYGDYELSQFVDTAAAQRLALVAAQARARTGQPVPDLASWYTLTLPEGVDAERAMAELRALPEVDYAEPSVDPAPPPASDTPDFTGMQGYFRSAAANGIDADFSRADPRMRGAGIKIVDLEYDWNEHHEDLQLPDPGTDLGGTAFAKYKGFNDQHGTAVMGILGALDNEYGVTGGVPDADLYGISPTRASGGYNAGAALAYLAALQDENGAAFLQPGDAVLLEQQGGQVIPDADCPLRAGTCYSPLEWNVAVHQAVTLLTSMGVTVVATGGNGANSTDHPAYTRNGLPWFRPDNSSGSIFVGAGSSTTRERLNFSNYGPRFDLQGWGQGITSTGHGGTSTNFWPTPGGGDPVTLNFRYTASFGGTSGAGPIVTTAVVAIQSYLKATGQQPRSAQEIADLLEATGQPQGANTAAQHIGPLPDLRAALTSIEVDRPETTLVLDGAPAGFGVYTNPVVTLQADDGWGSGVNRVMYRLDGVRRWFTYSGPFQITGSGEHTIEYRSNDVNGNTERVKSFTFTNRGLG